MLPNFICPGAAKSGTTTLYDILKQHPEIYLPDKKEPFFFISERYQSKIEDYKKRHYSMVSGEKTVGDMSTAYLFFDSVPQRIYDVLGPDVKFVIMLRNPVDRAFSHYHHEKKRGHESKSFKKAIALENRRIHKSRYNKIHYSYITRGYYSRHIKNYLKVFPKENLMFVIFEEFICEPEKISKDIFKFLGVETDAEINYNVHANKNYMPRYKHGVRLVTMRKGLAGAIRSVLPSDLKKRIRNNLSRPGKKPMEKIDAGTAKKLMMLYRDDIRELEDIIGRDLTAWTKKY